MAHEPGRDDTKDASARFGGLTYADYRERAGDASLSETEKLGSPDSFREGFEPAILADFEHKLPGLLREGASVVDIGCGFGELTRQMLARAGERGQRFVAVDSPEMLALLPDGPALERVPGRFPDESLPALRQALPGGADVVIAYGVLQAVYWEANPFRFMDDAMSLLAPGGALLIGDVANHSKLRRFLNSDAGRAFHRAYMRTEDDPEVPPFAGDPARMDDGVLMGLMARARAAGFDAWLMPQPSALPVSNRREDLLIWRP
ncbi:class I SAM-dependent methyltransferase [Pseudoroseicyclus sp. H15]